MYGGHVVMKAFNGEQRSIETFDGYNEVLYGAAWKSQFLSGMMMPIMGFIGNLGYVAVCILGGWLAMRGAITVGDIQAFIQYVRSFTQPIAQFAQISNVLQQTAAAAERVFEFLDEPEEVAEPAQPVKLASRRRGSRVPRRPLRLQPGEDHHQRLLRARSSPARRSRSSGPTGAGKTTMVKLLMRFYDVNSGAILIDGHDIREFTREDLRKQFGMVLQDTWLYNGTIMENIRYGRLEATDEEVIAAAKAAHAAPLHPHAARTATRWCSTRRRATSRRARCSC